MGRFQGKKLTTINPNLELPKEPFNISISIYILAEKVQISANCAFVSTT